MTAKIASETYINKQASYRVGSLTFDVTIVDHRNVFGRDDVRIRPFNGSGEQWVNLDSVILKK